MGISKYFPRSFLRMEATGSTLKRMARRMMTRMRRMQMKLTTRLKVQKGGFGGESMPDSRSAAGGGGAASV